MRRRSVVAKVSRFFKVVYLKLFRINDTPQKIASGLGLGVFLGVMPGAGPIAALLFAFLFKANRAAALLGSLLTNTWLSIPMFLASARIGAVVTGADYRDITGAWAALAKDFKLESLLNLSIYKIIIPVIVGYAIVSFIMALSAYFIALIVIRYARLKRRTPRRR